MTEANGWGGWAAGALLGGAQNLTGAASGLASRGADLVRSGTKAGKSFLQESLGGLAGGAQHTFQDPQDGRTRTVTEVCHIAEGAFGAVVKVSDAKTGECFALKKICCQDNVQVASTVEAAELEAKILQNLPPHPNIIRCFGSSIDQFPQGGGALVKLMLELCPNGHLLQFMDARNGKLSAKEVLDPAAQIAAAVRHLHKQSPPIQHRDLKVENVLQAGDGRWKLCDFGSCSTEKVPAQELSRGRLLKLQEEIDKTVTMLYRPPEMADIELNYRKGYVINEQVDMWMVGCILYTLAFYRHPFQDNATAMAITNAKYFIPYEHPMAKSEKLCGLIHWLLAADPKDRPNAGELCKLFKDITKCSYEELHALMPQAVREKIQTAKTLFERKGDQRQLPSALEEITPEKAAALAAAAKRPSAGGPAPRRLSGQGRATPADETHRQRPQAPQPAQTGMENDLFDISAALAPTSTLPSTVSAPALSSATTTEDLLGFTMSPSEAPAPGPAQPLPLGRGNSAPAAVAAATDWADFGAFAAPPSATAVGTTAAGAPGGGFGGDFFADFSAAPPPPYQPAPVSAVAPAAAGSTSVNLLDL